MKIGKISEPVLKRSVFKTISYKNKYVETGFALGNDGAVFNIKQPVISTGVAGLYMSADNFLFDCKCALNAAINNVWAGFGKPVAVMLDITMPRSYMESDLRKLMENLVVMCKDHNIQIAGGNSQVTTRITSPMVNFTVIGEKIGNAGIVKEDMDIVMTKHIGISGTAIMAIEKEEELLNIFQKSYINMALKNNEEMSIASEAAVAVNFGVCSMHDISRGGIFAALWEIACNALMGLEVNLSNISVSQETIEFCEVYNLNPYKLISNGALLIVCEDGGKLVRELIHQGIDACVIGKITAGNDKVVIKNEDRRFLEPPKGDEIYKLYDGGY